ncbi:uncharacterized protein LOC132734259 [Ruditapes philippinarum]|uniref:uncharacterized protein LOC132734259 n=1 Tax=Ruditapes philippinarum TaxID=129788 RepID=UPI00295A789A|nr:uncharacterized protein LOC132734259 [Ruditapes philippinarum]
MDRLFCYHIVLMLVATIAFILFWIGFATPGWLVVTFQENEFEREYTVSSLNRSLFYDILCPQELFDCKTCQAGDSSMECVRDMAFVKYTSHYTWIELLTSDTEEWVAWRVIMVLVMITCTIGFILVLCLVCCIFRTFVYRAVALTAFFLWIIAGILTWIPVGMVTHMHLEIHDSVNDDVIHDSTLHIPYSVVLVALAAFLAIITALMLLCLIGRWCGNRSDKLSETDTSVTSRQVTPRDRRYYGPHPYYPTERPLYYYREQPIYVPRKVETFDDIPVDDYQYKATPVSWGPNPWYDNRMT